MFYVVQLNSNIFKEKIVVPSIWLDKYDTHCLLPPITDVADVEILAEAQSTPKHGWQMHTVSFIQSFDTYSQAKANITRGNPVRIDLEQEKEKQHHMEVRGKRKRRLPRFLEQYSIGSDDDDDEEEKEGCDSTEDNCSTEDSVVLDPVTIKIEAMEDTDAPEITPNKSSSSIHSSLQQDSQLQNAGSSSSTISPLRKAVKTFVQCALPNLNDSRMTTVTDTIIAEEPSELQDLIYFKEDDFLPVLTKIQARKLIDYIQNSFSTGKRRAEIVEICRKSMEMKKVSTQQALEIEKSVNTAESETELSNVSQLSCLGENWANDFEIPYEKFPPSVLKHCREGTRPTSQERKHVIRILADEIFELCKKPGKRNLAIIVSKLIKKYPESFADVIGNQPFGNGYASFLNSLISRFENMKRINQNALITELPETQKNTKKRCIDFQPDNLSKEETENSLAEKQTEQQMHFLRQYEGESEVDKTVSMAFASQIEKSANAAETEAEPPKVPQSSCLDDNWADNFQIPYEKFPPNVLKHCRAGSRPTSPERKQVIRILANEIFQLCKKPGKKNLAIIVSKLVKRYPKSFQDVIGDEQFGNGYASFLYSLIQRFDNMNRTNKNSLIVKLPETQQNSKERCINFQPDNLSHEETEIYQTEKQTGLQMQFLKQYEGESEVNETMSRAFPSQIEKSVNTPETKAELSKVPQFSCFGENWADNFKIPYEKFPPNVLKHCREGSRPTSQERKHVIRILAYDIFKLCKKPGKRNLEIIVSKLIKKYPESFADVIGNQPFGNGYASFLNSLTYRLDNMKRINRKSLIGKLPEIQKKAKKYCINFQPDTWPNEETENSQTEKQKCLQMHFFSKYQNEDEVDEAMSMTFASQRLTINTVDEVEEAVKEWPYLTLTKYLLAHFNTAMQPYLPDWDCIFQRKIPELLRFLRSQITAVATSECSSIAILQLLCLYFKEENTIVQIYKDSDTLEVINKDTCPLTPFIAVFGTNSAVVFIERKAFSQFIAPDDAFKMWFASYFVFNLVYPEECQATMQFIQRGLMGIPPDSSCKKQAMSKCLKLVRDLSNFKDMWKDDE